MEGWKKMGEDRNWKRWNEAQGELDEVYKVEEEYWSKRSKVRWLKEGDKNTRYFHAVTAQRRRVNRIERLKSYEGQQIEGENELGKEITNYFGNLFTTSGPNDREKTMEGMRCFLLNKCGDS